MPLTVDGFLKQLSDSGVLTAGDVSALEARIPLDKRQADAEKLVRQLVHLKTLTPFQANVLYNLENTPLSLGNYILQDKIGTGGMGIVYRAHHRRMKREVAIKVLSPTSINAPNIVKRFLREAEAAAKLIHPNIVAAFDADEINGVLFLAMEYVDGVDLAQLLRKSHPLNYEKVLDYITQAARGFEHAHQQGIVHRDIKPANMLLDAHGVVKILDMGLARFSDTGVEDVAEAAGITQTGGIVGTIDFMSPEQATDSRFVDQRSDVYSLGATMFYLLTARPMYEDKSLLARVVAHRDSPIPWISSIRSDVPSQIDTIFHRMVAKKKDDRYPSMAAVLEDLTNWHKITSTSLIAPVTTTEIDIPPYAMDVIFEE